MKKPILMAGLLVAVLGAWLASGMLSGDDEAADMATPARLTPEAMLVEVQGLEAERITRSLVNQGDVAPFRQVALRTGTAGDVAAIAVDKGARVEEGDLVVRLDPGDLQARLAEAQALLAQREAGYEGAVQLGERGYTPEQRVRELYAALQSARAAVERIRQDVEDTTIEAPFGGVVNAIPVEEGEFVPAGGEVATLIDNDPLVVTVQIPQQSVGQVGTGVPAEISFVTGERARGTVTFVSASADRATRTFTVEIQIPNPDSAIPSGISAETRIPVDEVPAHFLSPALLSLSTEGVLGVKTVDAGDIVRFHPIDIVRAEADGIWVSGLPDEIRLITVGQGFVREGETVAVAQAPAATWTADAPPELVAEDTRPRGTGRPSP